MTKVTNGGITIENGTISTQQNATASDLQGAFSAYANELAMDGGLTQDDLNEISKLTGQFSQIFSTLPVYPKGTTQPNTTPQPNNTTQAFDVTKDGGIQSKLKDSKTYQNLDGEEKTKFEYALSKTKNKDEANALIEKLDKLGNDKGQIEGFGTNKDKYGNREVKSGTNAEKFYTEILGNKNPPTTQYSYKNDPVFMERLKGSKFYEALGSQYGEKAAVDRKLEGAKSKEEVDKILSEIEAFNKNGSHKNYMVDGYAGYTRNGKPVVTSGTEVDNLLKYLNIKPTYYNS